MCSPAFGLQHLCAHLQTCSQRCPTGTVPLDQITACPWLYQYPPDLTLQVWLGHKSSYFCKLTSHCKWGLCPAVALGTSHSLFRAALHNAGRDLVPQTVHLKPLWLPQDCFKSLLQGTPSGYGSGNRCMATWEVQHSTTASEGQNTPGTVEAGDTRSPSCQARSQQLVSLVRCRYSLFALKGGQAKLPVLEPETEDGKLTTDQTSEPSPAHERSS